MKARLPIATATAVVVLLLGVSAALAGGSLVNAPRFPSDNEVNIPAVDFYETRAS